MRRVAHPPCPRVDTSRRLEWAPSSRPGHPGLPLLGWRETKPARGVDRTVVASYYVVVFGVGLRASNRERPGKGVPADHFLVWPPPGPWLPTLA